MNEKSSQVADLKEDKKFAAIIIGGSLLISLVTILIGDWVTANAGGSWLTEAGYGISTLGWVWVFGSVMTGLYLEARMRQFRREAQTIRVQD